MQIIQFPELRRFAINWININEFFVSKLKTKERVDCCYCILLKILEILEIDSKEQFLTNEILKINKTIIKNSQSYFVLNDKLSKIKINSDNSLSNCLDSIIYTLNFYINGLGTNLCGTINNFYLWSGVKTPTNSKRELAGH